MELVYLADRPEALALVARWYHDEWGYLIEGETQERTNERVGEYLNCGEMPFILLAVDGPEVLGAAQLKFYEMKDLFPDEAHWLGGVYVSPGHRGRGLGSYLAEAIAARARGLGVETLHLQTERLDGGLYARLGWRPVAQVNNHGLEVLVMARRLVPIGAAPKWPTFFKRENTDD
jgi:GNAT superfamily N-acetyltransferase